MRLQHTSLPMSPSLVTDTALHAESTQQVGLANIKAGIATVRLHSPIIGQARSSSVSESSPSIESREFEKSSCKSQKDQRWLGCVSQGPKSMVRLFVMRAAQVSSRGRYPFRIPASQDGVRGASSAALLNCMFGFNRLIIECECRGKSQKSRSVPKTQPIGIARAWAARGAVRVMNRGIKGADRLDTTV